MFNNDTNGSNRQTFAHWQSCDYFPGCEFQIGNAYDTGLGCNQLSPNLAFLSLYDITSKKKHEFRVRLGLGLTLL